MPFDPNEPRDAHGKWTEGSDSPEAAAAQAAKTAGGHKPLEGLPQKPIQFGKEWYVPGPNGVMKDVAAAYMKSAGLPYDPPTTYEKLDKERAARIAQEFEDMKHDPKDPEVRAAYEAMAKETIAQWDAIKKTGLKVEWLKPDANGHIQDPYADNPRRGVMDVALHNHWWGFPTDAGFGSGDKETEAAMKDHPLLRETGETIDGRKVVVNDIFRIVHDMMGHVKEGNGFRAEGEENAWRSHAAMYSEKARPAMTSETRGQNSWVNYGPHGEFNRHANAAETIYSPQKVGLMKSWTWKEGAK